MSDKLSGETQKKIIELCIKISVAHNLDDEIREELFTHMEDKLLGYINGNVAITEEDAFIPFYFRSVVLVPVIYVVIAAIKTIRSKWQPALNR